MAKYFVMVKELHISTREIEAKDANEALGLVSGGDGSEVHCEWSHALPTDAWDVDDSEGNEVLVGSATVVDITG